MFFAFGQGRAAALFQEMALLAAPCAPILKEMRRLYAARPDKGEDAEMTKPPQTWPQALLLRLLEKLEQRLLSGFMGK